MPGTDPAEAIAVVLGELPHLPFLPELPARGPGSDLIGRTAALLVDLPAETTAGGWRLAARPGRDVARAAGMMSADLDAMEEAAAGFTGTFKIQLCGPWTLAATLELSRSIEPVLADPGALADLVASLAEGVAGHVAAVRRRLPGATLLVQLDEPALPGVLAGAVPSASGLRRLSAVDTSVAMASLRRVLDAAQAPTLVHCCAPEIPFACITKAGASAAAFDLALVRRQDEDALGEAVEAGLGMFAGAVPTTPGHGRSSGGAVGGGAPSDGGRSGGGRSNGGRPGGGRPDSSQAEAAARDAAMAVIRMWRRIGLPVSRLSEQVVISPACGLADASPASARAVLAQCQTAARLAPELIEDGVT
jgi:uncharacterized membrane protein YgcG